MSLPSHPRLRQDVELFPAPDGDLYLIRTDGTGDLIIRNPEPVQRALLQELVRNRAPVDELLETIDEGLGRLSPKGELAQLAELDLLEDAEPEDRHGFSPTERDRYDRQLAYFAHATPNMFDAQARLREATVVVIGVGGLGSWTLAALACAGVGRIVAVDDDTIDLSNLNRQILYRTADVGRRKVDVAAEVLGAFTPHTTVEAVPKRIASGDDASEVIADADFAVETADSPAHLISRWINRACLEHGVPHISAGQFPPLVRIGPTFVPGATACFECQEQAIRRGFPHYDRLVEHRLANPAPAATLGPASGLIGSTLAMEIVHHLTGIHPAGTTGSALIIDLRTLDTRREEVAPAPGCAACRGV